MTVKSKKDRIAAMIASLKKAVAGDYSKIIDISGKHDEFDSLAEAINKMLKKTGKLLSGQKQTKAKLRTSEKRYKNILDSMEESYFEVDLKGNLLFHNDTVLRHLGYTSREINNINFRQLVDDENAKKVFEVFNNVFLTGETVKGFDWEILRRDGGKIDVESSVALRRDEKGKPVGFRGVVRDVTKRKQTEEELKRSEERYRTILDIMGDAYYEMDLKGTYTFGNDTACKLFGYRQNELIGMSYRDILTPQVAHYMKEVYSRIYLTGKPELLIDYEIIDKDGNVKIHQMSAALTRDDVEKPNGFRALAWDVTEHKKAEAALRISEEKYRNILENMEEAYLESDLKGNLVFFNDALCRMLGYSRAELTNLNYRNCITPETIPAIFQIFNEIYRTDKPKTTIIHEFIAKDGSKRIVEMSISLCRDQSGGPTGFRCVARDVTEKIKAELALKESEQRYRMIVENVHDVVFTADFNFQFTFISTHRSLLTGYTPEEIREIPLDKLVTAQSLEFLSNVFAEVMELQKDRQPTQEYGSRTLEVEAYHKNGGTVWLEITATFGSDVHGKPKEIIAVARDITARKKIELALEESEKRYRMIVENMNESIAVIDLNLQYIYQSPSEIRITGYTPEEIMKIPSEEQVTPETYVRGVQMLAEELEKEFSSEPVDPYRSRTLEMEFYHKNGGTVWLEITASFTRDESGKPTGILLVGRNITERKKIQQALEESEKRYRMIVENIHEVVLTTDLNLHQTYVSPSCLWLIGYNQEEVMSLPIDRLLTPDSFTLAQNTLAEELTSEFSGEPIDPYRSRTVELQVYHKNGGTVWLEITATFIRDENGKPTGLLMAGRDINARKKAEEEKAKLEEQLLQAQKMESVGRLAGGVAHDFNNMLNVILGYVELSKPKLTPGDPVLKDIEEIEKAAIRSRDVTSQLLAFSRKQIISPKIINLNELILSIQKTLARVIGEDVHLSFYPKEDLWQIKFDPTHIEQILFNLAANARDAMPGGGKLTMETNNVHLDEAFCRDHLGFMPGDYVVLAVSDSGSGIDKENLPYVFEPFFTTKDVGKGTGLGLAMVYGIVKQNGGFINVYSEPGQGTTFKIYMTRNLEVNAMDATVEETKEESAVFSPAMILLVEDDDMVRGMITQMLKAIGYSVMAAATPGEALSLCEKGDTTVDLVITDVVMPVMNGRELRDKLRVVRPAIKVLFVSGYTSNVVVHHGILEEGMHFLQKPFSMNDLSRKISEALAGKRSY